MIDQYLQEQFIGKTFNEKLNNEIADYLTKRKFSVLGFVPRPGAIAMVHILDESGGIKHLGGSDPLDIINDNFGKWLAAMHTPIHVNITNPAVSLIGGGNPPIDTTATPRPTYYYNSLAGNSWNRFTSGVSEIQIGEGVTSPEVDDTDIETAFPSAPESEKTTVIGSGAYAPSIGRVAVGTNIGPTTDAGVITEMGLFTTIAVAAFNFMFSHDEISPSVPFIIGETIFAQYFFQL